MKKYLLLLLSFITIIHAGELSIGFSGNNRGLLGPCDCTIPAGGLAKISTVLEDIKQDHIQVGTGNHFFHHTPMKGDNQIHEQKKAFLQAELMKELNYSAVNVGQFDLCYGLNPLLQIQDRFELDLISANIVDLDNTHPFPAYKMIEYKGLDIMFIGVCQYIDEMNYKILDPIQTLGKLSDDGLFQEADLVILLADATSKVLSDFIKDHKGIDIIIASKEHHHTSLPMRFKQTDLVQLGSQGKYYAHLNVNFDNSEDNWTDLSLQQANITQLALDLKNSTEKDKKQKKQLRSKQNKLKKLIKHHPNNYILNMIFLNDGIDDDMSIKDRVESLTEGKK